MSAQENMQEVISQPPADCNGEHSTKIPLNPIKTIIGQLKNVFLLMNSISPLKIEFDRL
jgi:hypothetical protein